MQIGSPQLRRYHDLDGKNFLAGVGATKCATGWVYTYLRALREVTVSPLKELHFFDAKLPTHSAKQANLFAVKRLSYHIMQDGEVVENLSNRADFQASLDRVKMIYDDNEYFAHFARLSTPETKTLCDVTPAYAVIGQSGFSYMNEFFASQDVTLKIFFILRDPVDRLWSHLRYLEQNDPRQEVLKTWSDSIQNPAVIERADYRQTIEALDAVFPEQDILYLFYEDLFSPASMKTLCDFAQAEYMPATASETVNETSVKIDMPDVVRDKLLEILKPQYAFCRQRFGELVPETWRI